MSRIFTSFLKFVRTQSERWEICDILLQLTIPFHLQSKHQIALSFFIKIDDPNIIDYALLPTERQIIILLHVFTQQRTNLLTLLQNQGQDMRFIRKLIDDHHREVRTGIPLDFATAVQVSLVTNRRAPPPAAAATRDNLRDVQ